MTDCIPCPIQLNCSQMGLQSNGLCVNLTACITQADSLGSRHSDHQLEKIVRRWLCTECGYSWKSKPQSLCPHAPLYGPNRPYPGVAATRSDLQKMGLVATQLPVGVAWNMAGKEFYDLYDITLVKPNKAADMLRIFRIHRFWRGKMLGIQRTWKGWAEGEGLLKLFYTWDEAQQEIASLRSRPYQNPPYEYEIQPIPGLPDEIYAP